MSGVTNELYLQLYSSSPAPKRDYHGLSITKEYVILNSWDISHGPHVFPRRVRTPLEEFPEDIFLQRDIQNLFGTHVLQYVFQISRNEPKFQTLPHKMFLRILRFLAANDIIHLGQTSKIFFEICNSNAVWKILYRKRTKKALTNQDLSTAEKLSWKYMLKKKLTEKLAMLRITEKHKQTTFPKPSQACLDRIEMYSKPLVHKKRQPPPDNVPKLDLDLDFFIEKPEKQKVQKARSCLTLPSKKTALTERTDKNKSKNPELPSSGLGSKTERKISKSPVAKISSKKETSKVTNRSTVSPVEKSNLLECKSSPILSDRNPVIELKGKKSMTSLTKNSKKSSPIKSKNLD